MVTFPLSLPPLTDAIAPRGSSSKAGASVMSVLDGDTSKLEQAVSKGEGRATLRLKKDGQAVVEEVVGQVKPKFVNFLILRKFTYMYSANNEQFLSVCELHHSLLQTVWETKAADRVDDLLESFIGIRDLELGKHSSTDTVLCVCIIYMYV